ncbi:MAG TPA: type II toxin-antitoxin system HicB family antitoxin [Methylomirabilota bacterium]|nr:type II toxin-antitoxin system HicB family antitoxin [Methylomirabilota bacterium]
MTMQDAWPVQLLHEDEDFVRVVVRDLPEVQTSGSDEADAIEMAADAIEVVIGGAIDDGDEVPEPSSPQPGEHLVQLPAAMAAKLAIYRAFRRADITKTELARRIGVSEVEAHRILGFQYRTRLDRLDAAARALGVRLVIGTEPLSTEAAE